MRIFNVLNQYSFIIITALAILSFAIFFPSFYNSNDERNYIQNAHYLFNGGMVRDNGLCEGNGNETYGFSNGEGCVSKYNIGLSVLLAPLVNIHWKLGFIASFVFYIGCIYLFYKILKHYKLSNIYLYFYAFFPPLVYYSTRVMTEIYSHFLVLLIFYILFISKHKFKNYFIGILGGISVLIRYTNLLIIFPLVVGYLLEHKIRRERIYSFLKISLTAAPFVLILIYTNQKLYGDILKSGYDLSGEIFFFSPTIALKQLLWYLLILNILYPLMLLISPKSKLNEKKYILFSLLLVFTFYLGFPGFDFKSGILNLIIGLRFFVPIIGIVLVLYFQSVNERLRKLHFTKFTYGLVILLIIMMSVNKFVMDYTLAEKRNDLAEQSEKLYENSKEGDKVEGTQLLINEAFKKGFRYLEPELWVPLKDRKY